MKKIIFITISIVSAVLFSACLKDKGESGAFYDAVNNPILEFEEATAGGRGAQPEVGTTAINDLPVNEEYTLVRVRVGGQASQNNTDINYKIDVNNSLLPMGIIPLPAGSYTIVNPTGVIPAGQEVVSIKIKLNKTLLGFTDTYGVGVVLTSSNATINNNGYTFVGSYLVKNKYDGVYDLRVKTVGWSAYGILDGIPKDYPRKSNGLCMGLVSAGATEVTFYGYELESALLPAFSTTAPTVFGATTPKFTFDATTNLLTNVQNTTPDDGRGRRLLLNPAITNSRFDPATRTVYAAFIMKQNGRPDQFIYDTLTYTGPRP